MNEKLKDWLIFAMLIPIYIQVRIIYLPVLWIGLPGFVDWCVTKRVKPGTEEDKKPVYIFYFINRDLPRLAGVYLYFGFSLLVSWLTGWSFVYGMLSTGILMLSTSILYWAVMKFVKKPANTK